MINIKKKTHIVILLLFYNAEIFLSLPFILLCLDLWKTTQLSREDWEMGQRLVTYVRDSKHPPTVR